jgi:hypothetical protein
MASKEQQLANVDKALKQGKVTAAEARDAVISIRAAAVADARRAREAASWR